MHNDPLIKLEHTDIPVVNEYKFLGIRLEIIIYPPYKIPEN